MSNGTTPAVSKCPHCAGVSFRWRVKRVRGAGSPASQRTLLWSCVGCGAEVEEPLARGATSAPGTGRTGADPNAVPSPRPAMPL